MTDRPIALVTGGGQGIGLACARALAEDGARIVLADIKAESVKEAAESLGDDAVGIAVDMADPAQVDAMFDRIEAEVGPVSVLVNNAGIAIAANIETTTLEDWRRTMSINLDGVFFGCKAAVAAMKGRGGSIINLSSIDGVIGEAELAAYCASKGGVRTLTKAVAVHCGEQGYRIRCNSIHPGYIMTPQTEQYLHDLGTFEDETRTVIKRHPIGFLGEPDDIAHMVVYLASDESRFVTGAEMVVDGGYLAA